ncbi:MAG: zinc/iron permease [Parcubacteria group bacterium Gr01-1014_20]|nr:MAG: zinc/iron permease [Parcubacteria group bacterium Gr01-1014_20]
MFTQILIASVIGGIFSLAGGLILLWREDVARKFSLTLVSFAAGSLIGAAFLELIPEAVHDLSFETISPLIIFGIITLFILEKFLNWYHRHDEEPSDYHALTGTVLFGDALHNFIDGIIIALSFSVSTELGLASAIAVFFHEVPQEIGDFGILLHAGYSRKKIIYYNVLTALTAPLGAVIGYLLLPVISPLVGYLLAFAAGTFIYIAVSDLLPELKHTKKNLDIGHLLSIFLGIVIIWLIGGIFPE